MAAQVLSSGRRKYTSILEALVQMQVCRISCALVDARTIIDGVKKEKVKWKARGTWPKGKALTCTILDDGQNNTGISFKMIVDTSVNNL